MLSWKGCILVGENVGGVLGIVQRKVFRGNVWGASG